jgi:hypothetical protein
LRQRARQFIQRRCLQENPPWLMRANTLAELTSTLSERLDMLAPRVGEVKLRPDFTARLAATIERFNGFAKKGVDEDFGRGGASCDLASFSLSSRPRPDVPHAPNPSANPTMFPIAGTGPYYAIILARGALDTNGGPVINANAQICNQQGEPIAGLYGAGNCIASPTREAYFGGGGTIGPAIAFAHAAVEHASSAS